MTGTVFSLAFSPNGQELASGGGHYRKSPYNMVRIWDAATTNELASYSDSLALVFSVVYSRDGRYLAATNPFRLWDTNTRTELYQETVTAVMAVAFSPKGNMLALASFYGDVLLWDISSKRVVATLTGHSDTLTSVAFNGDGKYLVSGSQDMTVRIWDVEARKELRTLTGHADRVNAVAFSPDGRIVASTGRDRTLRAWDAASGRQLWTKRHGHSISCVAFSPDGKTLASGGGDLSIQFWDPDTGRLLGSLEGHQALVTALAYSPDGKTLASGSFDDTIRLWDLATKKARVIDLRFEADRSQPQEPPSSDEQPNSPPSTSDPNE